MVIHQNKDKYFGHAQKIGMAVSINIPGFFGGGTSGSFCVAS
jgi:hypothetical protein